ncbi:MAG: hypothetical protein KAT34_19910 [Candidatus Aminicenantes bacterium]|nr:hypothetical protein [Candidatus Aminicenantes bacterium]
METALERGIIIISMLILWGWVVYAILDWRKMKHKSQLQHKIVEKFSGVQEMNDFLRSDSGSKFLDFLTIKGLAPKEKLLSSIKTGIILLCLGIAALFVGPLFTQASFEVKIIKGIAILVIALGIGFLVSTFISYLLSKKWGLIEKE